MKKLITPFLLMFATCANLFAEEAAQQQNAFAGFIPLIVIFVIFYFMLIRPQSKRQKEHEKMVNALKKDDRVITTGGLYATVISVKENIVEAKIAENVKVQILKSAVATVLPLEGAQPQQQASTPQIIK